MRLISLAPASNAAADPAANVPAPGNTVARPARSPSFRIKDTAAGLSPGLRLDRIDSRAVIQAARLVLFSALQQGHGGHGACGVVLSGNGVHGSGVHGRLVFGLPVLLPDEQFVPMELIRATGARAGATRLKLPRRSATSTAP